MAFYRNQTPTMDQIKMLGNLRITTPAEATAFLRTVQPIYEQIAYVLQRGSLREQQAINKEAIAPAPEPAPEPVSMPVETKEFIPADLGTEESFSPKEIEAKVAKLKSAKKVEKTKKA